MGRIGSGVATMRIGVKLRTDEGQLRYRRNPKRRNVGPGRLFAATPGNLHADNAQGTAFFRPRRKFQTEARLQKVSREFQTGTGASRDRRSDSHLYVLECRPATHPRLQPGDEMDCDPAQSGRSRLLGVEYGNQTQRREFEL